MGNLVGGTETHGVTPMREMLNEQDVLVYLWGKSLADEDQHSALTDPLDVYFTEDQLWNTFKMWRRHPLPSANVSHMEVTEEKIVFKDYPGWISSDGDLLVEEMTLEEAKKKSQEIEYCKGFSFEGPVRPGKVACFFKDHWDISDDGLGGWTSIHAENVQNGIPHDCILCRRTFDRHKLFAKELIPIPGHEDPVRISKTWFDEENRRMLRMCTASDGNTQIMFMEYVKLHSNPLIMEIYRVDKRGDRFAGPLIKTYWGSALDQILSGTAGPPQDFEESHDFQKDAITDFEKTWW